MGIHEEDIETKIRTLDELLQLSSFWRACAIKLILSMVGTHYFYQILIEYVCSCSEFSLKYQFQSKVVRQKCLVLPFK